MFDVHMHVIPGVDDGALNLAMSRSMLELAWEQGVRAVIATPHSSAFLWPERVMERYAALRAMLQKLGFPMEVALGCEVLFAGKDDGETVARLERGELPTLNGTRCVLAEFTPDSSADYVADVLKRLRAAGFEPVVAHAERYPGAFSSPERAAALRELGMIQINAYSLVEEKNEGIRGTARMLVERRLADFVGSDAHRMERRSPRVSAGVRYIRERCDAGYARALLYGNAKRWLGLGDHPYRDGLLGLAVGDALGVPYEQCGSGQARRELCAGMVECPAHRQPAGTWSDDTAMSLCVGDSLAQKGVDPDDVMKRFSAWKNRRQYTATGAVFDVGLTCRRAIDRYDMGAGPDLCGDYTEEGNGNGGLMRAFPASLYACRNMANLDDVLRLVHAYSALTHGHPVGLICCGLYTLFIREWLNRGAGEAPLAVMDRAIEAGREYYSRQGGGFAEAINRPGLFLGAEELRALDGARLPTSGYVVNTWNIAVWSLLNTDSYRDCVLRAVNLGGDADTNAAVAGSLAGLVYGCEDIPGEWLEALQNRRLVEQIARRLDAGAAADDSAPIERFEGEHAFLAMKAPSSVEIDGVTFDNLTAAWLSRGVPLEHRREFAGLTAHRARRLFNQLPRVEDWESAREEALREVCLAKFAQNPDLAQRLLATGHRSIVYDTTGSHDNDLGRCACERCRGAATRNLYGEALMEARRRLRGG